MPLQPPVLSKTNSRAILQMTFPYTYINMPIKVLKHPQQGKTPTQRFITPGHPKMPKSNKTKRRGMNYKNAPINIRRPPLILKMPTEYKNAPMLYTIASEI